MSTLRFTQLPLTYADSISFESAGSSFQIKFSNAERRLVVFLKDILFFSFSKGDSDEDWLDIIHVTDEYRQLTKDDLRNYLFAVENLSDLQPMHIITIHGSSGMKIICNEI